MTYKDPRDQVIDDDAIKALIDAYGERVTSLPPVAIVIAAYNEAGAIGPVVEALPAEVCGLATATIVVADGCADSTAAEAAQAGAMVCDVPVNRGQGAALRLGYRLAREGGTGKAGISAYPAGGRNRHQVLPVSARSRYPDRL